MFPGISLTIQMLARKPKERKYFKEGKMLRCQYFQY